MRQPLVSLVWRQAVVNQRLRGQVRVLEAELDRTQQELIVQQARVRRWRMFVASLASGMPERVRAAVEFQQASDDIADLDERDERERA